MNKSKINYLDIDALLDNELNSEEKKQVIKAINNDKDLFNYFEKIKDQNNQLKHWWSFTPKH